MPRNEYYNYYDHYDYKYSLFIYKEDGFDARGYDRDGFDKNGYDANGFDRNGKHKKTGTSFDPDGYDMYGYDKNGYNEFGFTREGFSKEEMSSKPIGEIELGKEYDKQYGFEKYEWKKAFRSEVQDLRSRRIFIRGL